VAEYCTPVAAPASRLPANGLPGYAAAAAVPTVRTSGATSGAVWPFVGPSGVGRVLAYAVGSAPGLATSDSRGRPAVSRTWSR